MSTTHDLAELEIHKARDLVKVASEHLVEGIETAISNSDKERALDELGMTMTVLEEALEKLDEIV